MVFDFVFYDKYEQNHVIIIINVDNHGEFLTFLFIKDKSKPVASP